MFNQTGKRFQHMLVNLMLALKYHRIPKYALDERLVLSLGKHR